MALQQIVEQTVAGLGYDLVEIERSAGGLLRITIDLVWVPPTDEVSAAVGVEQFITVEDCEKVTRQLQFALEVEGVDIVNGTPLLDIKPYVPEFDSHPGSKAGWFDESRSQRRTADGRFEEGAPR